MKKSTVISVTLGGFMLAVFVYQALAVNQLVDNTCLTNPFAPTCTFARFGISTGEVEAQMNGLCDEGSDTVFPEVFSSVYAFNCYPYVDIHAGAWAYYTGPQGLDSTAYTLQCGDIIYEMWDTDLCNGTSPSYIPGPVNCGYPYGYTCGPS